MAPSPIALLMALVVGAVAAPAGATQFRVGGQQGWSVPGAGSEPYNTWAGRLRFQIGDQLLFVYPKATDSVLLVDAAAYNACNTSSYAARFDDGSTVFTFDRSGPFFFVSGNQASCRANQKLIVVVLADRSGARTPPAAPPLPSPPGSPPAAAPGPSSASGPATSPASPPPSSGAAAAAAPTSPPPSPVAPAPAPGPTTTTTPSSPPEPAAQTPSPSTTPTPGGGSSSTPPSASANDGGGGSSTTPPPPSAAAHVVAAFVGSLGAFIGYAILAA